MLYKDKSVFRVYEQIINELNRKEIKTINAQSVYIHIEDPFEHELPEMFDTRFDEYYSDILMFNTTERWSIESDWYYSFARRLTSERQGRNYYNECIEILKNNINSRRAVIATFDCQLDNQYGMPALMHIQFLIRDNKLNLITTWRSKELFTSFCITSVILISLLKKMYCDLKLYYPILEVGSYSEFISDLHVESKSIIQPDILPVELLEYTIKNEDYDRIKFLCSIVNRGNEGEFDEQYR